MPKHLFITLFALLGISTAVSAQGLAQEIGIYAGPVTLQSDFGERNNFDNNVGNTGFGIGIMHFINFSANNNRENYFTEHFKVRSDLSFSRTTLKHFGEWVERKPNALFAQQLNENMCLQNVYYQDLIDGKILAPLRISVLQKNAFIDYMCSKGKLGGQNKVPRLSNDRVIADDLIQYISH